MAANTILDFLNYPELVQTGAVEVFQQNTNIFNAASAGAIRLGTRSIRGNWEQAAFFKDITGVVTRRDNTSTASVADLPITQGENVHVKVNRKVGPVASTIDSFRKQLMGMGPDEAAFIVGQTAGKQMQVDMVDTGILSARAALLNQAAVTTVSAATITTLNLVSALSKFGDASSRIVCWVMHSKVYFDLVAQQIAANIDNVSGFNVATATPITLNRPVIVVDSPSLIDGANYLTLGLTEGAIDLENSEDLMMHSEIVSGLESLIVRHQGEFSYNIGVKGFKYDVGVGANPTAAALGAGASWVPVRNSFKDFSGVILQTL